MTYTRITGNLIEIRELDLLRSLKKKKLCPMASIVAQWCTRYPAGPLPFSAAGSVLPAGGKYFMPSTCHFADGETLDVSTQRTVVVIPCFNLAQFATRLRFPLGFQVSVKKNQVTGCY